MLFGLININLTQRGRLVAMFATAGVVIFLTAAVYIYQLGRVVVSRSIQTMDELSLHDVKTTEGMVERSWDDLDRVAKRFYAYHGHEKAELLLQLEKEQASSVFSTIYLIDVDGNVYDDMLDVIPPDENGIDEIFEERGDSTFVVRYVDTNTAEGGKEERRVSLLYGIPMETVIVDGIEFNRMAALRNINVVRDQMRIESFGGRGYSTIINMRGEYIVSRPNKTGTDDTETFFSYMDKMKKKSMTTQDIYDGMQAGETIYLTMRDSKYGKRSMFLMPMSRAAWYFIMTVPYSIFTDQSRVYITMSIVMLFVMMSAIVVLLMMLFYSKQKTIRANATAQARSDFLSNMSHEIRTPLNGLIGLNHLMEMHIDDKERLKEYLVKFDETASYLLTLVNNILDMSKLQAGKSDLDHETMDIEDLFNQVCNMQRENMMTHDINFVREKNIYWKWVIGDKIRLMQVLMNLLGNAAKFTPPGGTVRFIMEQQTLADGRMETIFRVEDTGCGISREFLKHIFESFTQERAAQKTSNKGTGLGLAISYELVKRMGGGLTVQSKRGVGSNFIVTLPTKLSGGGESKDEKSNDKPTASPVAAGGREALNVLIAEDNDLNADILTEILQTKGFTSKRATNGEEAVAMFEASALGEFNVVLMDVQMPVMNGYKAAMAIRGLPRPDAAIVPIFACTANTFKEDKDRAFESGMTDFLAKPIDIDEMMRKLTR